MSQKNAFSDYFDDDFEVTYEETPGVISDAPEEEYSTQETIVMDHKEYEAYRSPKYKYDKYHDYEDEYDDDIDESVGTPSRRDRSTRRKRSRSVPLAAPIRKGGRALSRMTSALIRCLTALLILAVTAYVTWTFWRASTLYGDIMEAVRTRSISQTLAAYLCIPAIFLFFEFVSLCWSMTRVRVRDGLDTWKEDTGRGLFSFIAVFAVSYLCFLLNRFLPESPEVLYGIKGSMEVYGSMHNVLFGLCAAGAASCLLRKYWSSR